MWPKCCPSFEGATWDQDDFTQLLLCLPPEQWQLCVLGEMNSSFFGFCCSSQASFGGALLPGQLVFPHASWHQRDISGNTGGNWIFMKGRDPFQPSEHSSSPVVFSPLFPTNTHAQTDKHTHTQSGHTIIHTHTQEVQGLVPYQQAHTHLMPHCTHSYQKRVLITYNSRTHTHTHTDTHAHTPTHIWSNKTHRTWLVSWYNKHFNNIS